jgi:RimJ/RimL family protein N-acetyltransferase
MAQAHIDNIASQNVIEKCGLQFCQNSFSHGCDVKQYEIFSEEYFKSLHNNKN